MAIVDHWLQAPSGARVFGHRSALDVIDRLDLRLLPPLDSRLWFSPTLIEFDNPLCPVVRGRPAFPWNGCFPQQHPFVTGEQQRFRLRILFLSGQAGTEQGLAVVADPCTRTTLISPIHRLTQECLSRGIALCSDV